MICCVGKVLNFSDTEQKLLCGVRGEDVQTAINDGEPTQTVTLIFVSTVPAKVTCYTVDSL